jgi:ABC-type multidrug transport system fused ATPase/permease subunit
MVSAHMLYRSAACSAPAASGGERRPTKQLAPRQAMATADSRQFSHAAHQDLGEPTSEIVGLQSLIIYCTLPHRSQGREDFHTLLALHHLRAPASRLKDQCCATPSMVSASEQAEPAVSISSLSFAYPESPKVIDNVTLQLPRGARCLLVGANGAGVVQ